MKRIVLVSIAVLALATTVFAQNGRVMLYSDPGFLSCNSDNPAVTFTAYVVHDGHPGAMAVQYAITDDTGGALSYLADINPWALVIGNSQAGVAVSYGGCQAGQVHAQSILYSVLSNPPVCSTVSVIDVIDPDQGPGIYGVDCLQPILRPLNGSVLTFNEDGSCACGEVVPVEETNWGRVKALYQ